MRCDLAQGALSGGKRVELRYNNKHFTYLQNTAVDQSECYAETATCICVIVILSKEFHVGARICLELISFAQFIFTNVFRGTIPTVENKFLRNIGANSRKRN
jgi:hypothetical protein